MVQDGESYMDGWWTCEAADQFFATNGAKAGYVSVR